MKLIIMTLPTFFVEEDKILTALFDEGLDNLHLRKPGASPMYSERLLSLLPDAYRKKITVHDHYYLKNEYDLAGIHVDEAGSDVPQGYKGKLSRTCEAIERLAAMKKKSEYVLLGSVFEPMEELSSTTAMTTDELRSASRRGLLDKRVYAMGGVNLDRIKEARDLGFGGVVIRDDLWSKFDIHNELDYKELISHFDKLRKAVS